MKYLEFTYDREYLPRNNFPTLPKAAEDRAREQFKSTGLDMAEWLTWRAQYEQEYFKVNMPACPKCGTAVTHEESLLRKGAHGDDPEARHRIFCAGCGSVFADYTHWPGISLDAIQKAIAGDAK